MHKIVQIVNKTGYPKDTEVIVDGKPLPLSHMMNVGVSITPDNIIARVELRVDELDTLAKVNLKG